VNRVIFAPQAEIDLLDIARHIAAGSPTAAYAFIDAIQQKCELLAANPEMGRLREELAPRLRSFSCRAVCHLLRTGIEVARILHGAGDIPMLF
jgi:toxin ParE1/3/4